MNAPATHACAACGGTGCLDQLLAEVANQASAHSPAWTEDLAAAVVARLDCHVCRGEGRLPDRMPARDAMADAETLLLASNPLGDADYAGQNGRACGKFILFSLVTYSTRRNRINDHSARMYAIQAARAAFRAVPGLRGDR